jgi:hypothetical protein
LAAASALAAGIFLAAYHVAGGGAYTSGSTAGYSLGVLGGSLMLAMLLYPLRKRIRMMRDWGAMKYWFRLHMLCGVVGPVLVLFHSTFRVGSLNAGVALGSMLLVVASGLIGRYLYRHIHNGLYGSRASAGELRLALDAEFASFSPQLAAIPLARQALEKFTEVASHEPATWPGRIAHLVAVWRARRFTARTVRRLASDSVAEIAPLLLRTEHLLDAVQRTAQFSTYERLFSLWHVVHIPFLGMLVITAVVHVVAVHLY